MEPAGKGGEEVRLRKERRDGKVSLSGGGIGVTGVWRDEHEC